jgi:hypothetical protein
MYPLTVERADTSRLEMPIVKADVHAPIFCFPKFFWVDWGMVYCNLMMEVVYKSLESS